MIELERILCPIDFSAHSDHAFAYALSLARWYDAKVIALHVFNYTPLADMIPSLATGVLPPAMHADRDREDLRRLLQDHVERHSATQIPIEPLLTDASSVHREIVAQADTLGASMIVMGSHGRNGFEHLLLGSVVDKVLRTAHCPVMVIPPRLDEAASTDLPHVRRILCPVDFSESSLAGLTYAISLAEEADAQLTLLHVIETIPEIIEQPVSAAFDLDAVRVAAEAASLRRLTALVPDEVRQFCTVQTRVAEGRAAGEILGFARTEPPDLIVMGVHGRGALDLLVFGSNTHRVISASTCPVLAVHAHTS